MANKNVIFLPNMSENFPYVGWNAVAVKRYEVATQAISFNALKSVPILYSEVAIIV